MEINYCSLYAQQQKVQDKLEEKLGATECESGNMKVQWNKLCARHYEWLYWESRQESKKAMDYKNDQENK
jgi:hypothetical protein